jgi:hypothetical protein
MAIANVLKPLDFQRLTYVQASSNILNVSSRQCEQPSEVLSQLSYFLDLDFRGFALYTVSTFLQ